MIRDTGSPRADAESDFLRARRQQVMSSVATRFRSQGDNKPMSFTEAITALGNRGEKRLGTLVIPLDRIVGSVDKVSEFDRHFRPTSGKSRTRWERLAELVRRGEPLPPIDVYKVGDMYFVIDGHHRVSVHRALSLDLIEADVTEIRTALNAEGIAGAEELSRRHWRRIFLERVPLTGAARAELSVTNPDSYHQLAESVEAWSARMMHAEECYHDKETCAQRWYDDEFGPVVEMLRRDGLIRSGETDADAYLRAACDSYEVTRTHAWDDRLDELLNRDGRSKGSKR